MKEEKTKLNNDVLDGWELMDSDLLRGRLEPVPPKLEQKDTVQNNQIEAEEDNSDDDLLRGRIEEPAKAQRGATNTTIQGKKEEAKQPNPPTTSNDTLSTKVTSFLSANVVAPLSKWWWK